MTTSVYASPVDTATYGEYTIRRDPGDPRPLYRFAGRITADGSTPFAPAADRYHLYAGWFCPWAQRVVLAGALAGLEGVVGVSYVDGARDGRGWAFRETHGPDPVNGFTLLRDAYERTEPGFDGHVSVPTLWDTATGTVVSNDFGLLDIDLATQFTGLGHGGRDLYPAALRSEIDDLDAWLGPDVNHGAHLSHGDTPEAQAAARALAAAFTALDLRLSERRYLLGDQLTLADVRLWVTLVRHDAWAEAAGRDDARLQVHPSLWRYAREVFELPAVRSTTDFASFGGSDAVARAWRGQKVGA